MLSHLGGDIAHRFAACAKLHSAVLYVRARNIQLDHINVGFAQLFRHFAVFLNRVSGDIRNYHGILLFQPRQILLDKNVNARILQADSVQHSRRSFGDSRRRVAVAPFQRDTLAGNSAQHAQRIKLAVFHSKSKGARGGDKRIGKFHSGNLYRQISH